MIAFNTQYITDVRTINKIARVLNLKDDEIELFLMYCSNDPHSKQLVDPDQKFQLMDFMINKNKEFKKAEAAQK